MNKPDVNIVRAGWIIFEPHTSRIFCRRKGYTVFTDDPTDAPVFKTRKEAVSVAKHLGKGRLLTVAKAAITFNLSYQGAAEVTGVDSLCLSLV